MGDSVGRTTADRREELLAAAVRVIGRDGIAAATHRAVAAEAGVSHRLTTYYFQTKENMLEEAFAYLANRSLEFTQISAGRIAVSADRDAAMRSATEAVVDVVLGGLQDETGGVTAELALVLEIERQPSLAHDYAKWQDSLEAILMEHARALGSDDPAADARIILAAVRGFQIEGLGRPDRGLDRSVLRSDVERLLNGL